MGRSAAIRRISWPLLALAAALAAPGQSFADCSGAADKLAPLSDEAVVDCVSSGQTMRYVQIEGSAITEAIKATDKAIRIRDSVIKEGIVFRRLPRTEVSSLPGILQRHEIEAGDLGKFFDLLKVGTGRREIKVNVVKNALLITGSRIERSSRVGPLRRRIALDAGGTAFLGPVNFSNTTFGGYASFSRSLFFGRASFSSVSFERTASFSRSWFFQSATFREAYFGRRSRFFGARFDATAHFQRATFQREVTFAGARLCGRGVFSSATMAAGADFSRVRAARGLDFGSATFIGRANFQALESAGRLRFSQNRFQSFAVLIDTKIADLHIGDTEIPSRFEGGFDLGGAQVARVRIDRVSFQDDAGFSGARIGGGIAGWSIWSNDTRGGILFREAPSRLACREPAPTAPDSGAAGDEWRVWLNGVTFRRQARFIGTRFLGATRLESLSFESGADFTDADFSAAESAGDGPRFLASYLDYAGTLKISLASLPPIGDWHRTAPSKWAADGGIQPLSKVLAGLERNFRNSHRLEDAVQAKYLRYREEIRETLDCLRNGEPAAGDDGTASGPCQETGHPLLEYLTVGGGFLWGLLSRFGTDPWRVVAWMAVAIVAFAAVYARTAGLYRQPHPAHRYEHDFRLRFLEFPRVYVRRRQRARPPSKRRRRFYRALRFSTVVLLKLGRRDIRISGRPGGIDVYRIVALEWWLGVLLIATLIFTLTETQPFLRQLLAGAVG